MSDFVSGDTNKLFFFNGNDSALTQSILNFKKNLENPYQPISDWIRLKELELQALKNTLTEYKDFIHRKTTFENEKKDIQNRIENLKNGKKGWFATITLKDPTKLMEKYTKDLDAKSSDLESLTEILSMLDIYHSIFVYEFFNKLKAALYKLIKDFAVMQHRNCVTNLELWLKIKASKGDKNAENVDNQGNKKE